jgi:small subunit ribosomal protein S17
MADDEKNETTEETTPAAAEEVSDTAEAPEVEATPAEVSETSETPEAAETPAAEEVSDTAEAPEVEETPAEVSDTSEAPAKPSKSRKHVPRAQRRTRTRTVREKPKARKPVARLPKPDADRGRRQERRGVVVSDKADKTIVVKVDVIKSHPKYKKVIRSTVKFHAHDEGNTAGVGDTVRIVETRPLSRQKRWRLAEIVEKAK